MLPNFSVAVSSSGYHEAAKPIRAFTETMSTTKSSDKKSAPPRKSGAAKRTAAAKQPNSREIILDTVEKLMLDEGYAAVSTRRVAAEAGLKAPLVHYYFATTDDLFLAVFRRAVEREWEKLDEALASPEPLQALWTTYRNQSHMALGIEFMALANHRKAIKKEIAQNTERARQRRAEELSRLIEMKAVKPDNSSTTGLAVLMIGVARTLIMENGLGISLGHAEANAFVEWWLEHLKKR
jgi:AcrR family transcriptional regulator